MVDPEFTLRLEGLAMDHPALQVAMPLRFVSRWPLTRLPLGAFELHQRLLRLRTRRGEGDEERIIRKWFVDNKPLGLGGTSYRAILLRRNPARRSKRWTPS
jgi:hypothetical protein